MSEVVQKCWVTPHMFVSTLGLDLKNMERPSQRSLEVDESLFSGFRGLKRGRFPTYV